MKDYGILFPKGMYYHNNSLCYIGNDAIAYYSKNGKWMKSRMCAIVDAILFALCLPFMLLFYAMTIVLSICAGLVLLLFGSCITWNFTIEFMSVEVTSNKIFAKATAVIIAYSLMSFIYMIMYAALTPLRIIVPEFTTFIGEHKWGNPSLFDYLEN